MTQAHRIKTPYQPGPDGLSSDMETLTPAQQKTLRNMLRTINNAVRQWKLREAANG